MWRAAIDELRSRERLIVLTAFELFNFSFIVYSAPIINYLSKNNKTYYIVI